MNSTLYWLLATLAAVAFGAWRYVVLSRRSRAAAERLARESAAQAALQSVWKAAQDSARKSTAEAASREKTGQDAAAHQLALDKTAARDAAEARSRARAQADRVIAAEAARRQAAPQKTQEAERSATAPELRDRTAPAKPVVAVPTPLPDAAPALPAVIDATPVVVDAPAAVQARTSTPTPAFKTAAQTVILMVDDSKMVRVKTSRLLASHEFQVVTAVDGVDAIRQLETCRPDLVITDVDMPNMDGFGLTRHLRGESATAHLPIVMITSAEDRHHEEALRIGVGLVLGKPYPEDALLAHIRSFRFPAVAVPEPALA